MLKMIAKQCPFCGNYSILKLFLPGKWEKYQNYLDNRRELHIQDALPDPEFDKFEREFIKTGYCPWCQKKIFRNKLPGNIDERFISPDVFDSPKIKQMLDRCELQDVDLFEELLSKGDDLSMDEKIVCIWMNEGEDFFTIDADGLLKGCL